MYTSQAELTAAALKVAVQEKNLPPHIENGLWDLIQFFDGVVEEPRAWPVTGRMAQSLKIRTRRLKGPAQMPSRRNKRAARRQRRKEAHAARRANR